MRMPSAVPPLSSRPLSPTISASFAGQVIEHRPDWDPGIGQQAHRDPYFLQGLKGGDRVLICVPHVEHDLVKGRTQRRVDAGAGGEELVEHSLMGGEG